MRDSEHQRRVSLLGRPVLGAGSSAATVAEVPSDEKTYFESYYSATVRGEPTDRMTIGMITEMESRFHYNSLENSIIRALARLQPPPPSAAVQAWAHMQRRQGFRALDVGSGTGHWIDFMIDVFYVSQAIGLEFTDSMSQYLAAKYADREDVTILTNDPSDPDFGPDEIGGPVDFITSVGVMFHIINDARWSRAIGNLANTLKPGGLLLASGEFGTETANREWAKTDKFNTWREYSRAKNDDAAMCVTKRVRSLADWSAVACENGLQIVDLVRSDREPLLTTPENDLLVLRRRS